MARTADRLLILGGGGHGKVVADVARACGFQLAGFADADPAKLNTQVEPGGARVVALQEQAVAAARDGNRLPGGATGVALAIGDNRQRLRLAQVLGGIPLPVLAHPRAVLSPGARVESGTVVLAAAVINTDAELGTAVIVNTAAVVEHDCRIGDGAHISPGAVLAGGVHVGERSWIGAGAVVIPGVRIGNDAVVGAGAVVIRDVQDGQTVVGCPAKPIRRIVADE